MVLPKARKVWSGAEILDLPMTYNDLHAGTVREWLATWLADAWSNGQRKPWTDERRSVRAALARGGVLEGGEFDSMGNWMCYDVHELDRANEAVQSAIKALATRGG